MLVSLTDELGCDAAQSTKHGPAGVDQLKLPEHTETARHAHVVLRLYALSVTTHLSDHALVT